MSYHKGRARQRRHQLLRWAQDSICAGCGGHIPGRRRVGRNHPDAATFDHVVPRAKGGRRTLDNGLLKHRRCNQARGDAVATGCDHIWLAVVEARLKIRPVLQTRLRLATDNGNEQ